MKHPASQIWSFIRRSDKHGTAWANFHQFWGQSAHCIFKSLQGRTVARSGLLLRCLFAAELDSNLVKYPLGWSWSSGAFNVQVMCCAVQHFCATCHFLIFCFQVALVKWSLLFIPVAKHFQRRFILYYFLFLFLFKIGWPLNHSIPKMASNLWNEPILFLYIPDN